MKHRRPCLAPGWSPVSQATSCETRCSAAVRDGRICEVTSKGRPPCAARRYTARSQCLQAGLAASTGGSNRNASTRLLEKADDLARRSQDAYALAMVTLGRGVVAYLEGIWRDAQENCDRSETIFRYHFLTYGLLISAAVRPPR